MGAYTSQGKSMLLRTLAYHLLYTYGLNVVFISLEMSHDAVRSYSHCSMPTTSGCFRLRPISRVEHFKEGQLTDEQEDFLLKLANRDLTRNPEPWHPLDRATQ